jgi:hypothetical protein
MAHSQRSPIRKSEELLLIEEIIEATIIPSHHSPDTKSIAKRKNAG